MVQEVDLDMAADEHGLEVQTERNYIEDFGNIFIKKTCYRINNQKVETIVHIEEPPSSIIKSIHNFESGQVYEVVFRNFGGEFLSFWQLNKSQQRSSRFINGREEHAKFLIYIVNQ